MPSLKPLKLNIVLRFLERSGTILIDSDGYIIWTRGDKSESSSLSDVADLSQEFSDFLKKREG